MTRLSGSRAIMIGVALAVAMIGFWYEVAWSAQSQAITTAHGRQQTATSALLTAEQRLLHLKHLSVKAAALDAADAKLTAAVPSQDNLDQWLVDLNGDALSAGVTLNTLGITPPSGATAGTGTIPLQLTLSGGYFAIQRFLDLVRDGSRLVVVDKLTLSPAPGLTKGAPVGGQGTALTATFAGRVFLAKGSGSPSRPPAVVSKVATGTGVLETPINAARTAASNATTAANATDATSGAKP
jgi:Tfp pilus assembly protein PilO